MSMTKDASDAFNLVKSFIDPCVKKTKKLLLPFNLTNWLKIALVVFLVGGFSLNGNGGGGGGGGPDIKLPGDMGISPWLIIALVFVLIVLSLSLFFISSVSSFVLLDILFYNKKSLGALYKKNLDNGWQLFVFSLVVLIGFILGIVLLLLPVIFFSSLQNVFAMLPFLLRFIFLLIFIFLFITIILIMAIVLNFTKDFVTIIMMLRKVGLVEGWKILIKMLKNHLTYWVVFLVSYGIIAIILSIIPLIILIIPVLLFIVLLVGVGYLFVQFVSTLPALMAQLAIVIAVFGLLFLILLIGFIITALLLPIPIFLRYLQIEFLKAFAKKFRIKL